MYYINYNGIDLTYIINVKEVEIPSLPTISHSSIEVFERDGSIYNGASFGTKSITIKFIIKANSNSEYDLFTKEVKNAFRTKKEAKLFCGRDDIYIWCVPVDDFIINELGNNCAEGEISFIAYDPYWHSIGQNSANNNMFNDFIVQNKSNVEVYPIINIGFANDSTFAQISNSSTGETILLGGIPSREGTTIKANETVFEDHMESTSGWANTSAPIDAGRSTGGRLAVTSAGVGLMCSSLPSSSDAIWKGACFKKDIGTSLIDFKIKVKMSHNSTGTNGDPYHPYLDDIQNETIISGNREPCYRVSAVNGAVLRLGTSNKSVPLLTIPYNEKIIGEVTGNWLKVTYSGKTGYCSMNYLTKSINDNTVTATQQNFVTINVTPIKGSPYESSTTKKTIPVGTLIRLYTDKTYSYSSEDGNKIYYKMSRPYEGVEGYVEAGNIKNASEYKVEYDEAPETADDKTGIVEIYGFSSNNVQLFKLSLCDDNEYYEFTYPVIKKNGKDFLVDKTIAPKPRTVTTSSNESQKVQYLLSGKYGDWNEFYGELYIERINNKWYAYVEKITNGNVSKVIRSDTIVDETNSSEALNYIVIYIGTTNSLEKSSCMCVSDIEIKTGAAINNETVYNFQRFEAGDIITIDNNVPTVYLNNVEMNNIVDIGSSFFSLVPGENLIKATSDDTNAIIDILWEDKYL